MRISGGSSSTLVVDTNPVHQAGIKITNDAQSLQKDIDNAWTTYSGETGMVPAMCIRNDFDTLYDQQKPLTSKATANRVKIGQTLAQSATLAAFQDAVTAKSFDGPNIYQENPYYPTTDQVSPRSLQRPG